MEANNSFNRSDIQRQLYKALVDAYEADKILLDTYGDTVTIKRPRDGADDDQEPSTGTDRGSKRRRSGKEPESTSAPRETTTTIAGKTSTGSKTHKQSASQSALVEETMQSTDVFEAPAHQEFKTSIHDEQAKEENKSVPAIHESVQPWLINLARRQDPRESFDELSDTTFDFSTFVMNWLNVKTLTPELLAGPTFELMKGTCKSFTELEYFYEEVYKATTEKIDWINPEGRQYPHDLRKPLPLVLNSQEHAEFDESNANVLERFYTSAENPVKDILLKLNLPDHRSILVDSKVTLTKHGRMIKPYSSPLFIANCFNAGYLKIEVKVPDSS
ncbi:hypothetical protein Tco_0098522 [Tanacetum coccineum]